jgi:hypothetical protein
MSKPALKAGQRAFVTDHRWHIVEAVKEAGKEASK